MVISFCIPVWILTKFWRAHPFISLSSYFWIPLSCYEVKWLCKTDKRIQLTLMTNSAKRSTRLRRTSFFLQQKISVIGINAEKYSCDEYRLQMWILQNVLNGLTSGRPTLRLRCHVSCLNLAEIAQIPWNSLLCRTIQMLDRILRKKILTLATSRDQKSESVHTFAL